MGQSIAPLQQASLALGGQGAPRLSALPPAFQSRGNGGRTKLRVKRRELSSNSTTHTKAILPAQVIAQQWQQLHTMQPGPEKKGGG